MVRRTVEVWGNRCDIDLEQDVNTLWVATGAYKKQKIEVKDKTEIAAMTRWQNAARQKGA
jgi:hypothetical protein